MRTATEVLVTFPLILVAVTSLITALFVVPTTAESLYFASITAFSGIFLYLSKHYLSYRD